MTKENWEKGQEILGKIDKFEKIVGAMNNASVPVVVEFLDDTGAVGAISLREEHVLEQLIAGYLSGRIVALKGEFEVL